MVPTIVVLITFSIPPTNAVATTLMTEDVPAFGARSYGQPMAETGYSVAAYMGAKMMRLHTGRDASFTWQSSIDPFVNDATRRGFKPYLTLTYRRRYRDGPDPTFLGVPSPSVFGAWCGEAASRYLGKVRDYGVFNEPNYFGDGMTPQVYNALYRACYAAIKQIDPTAKVYYGEIAADQDASDPCAWVTNSLSSSNPTLADGIAIHTYQWTTPPNQTVPGFCRGIGRLGDWQSLTQFWFDNGQSLKRPQGGPVPILITEHGYCAPHGECPPYSDGSGANNRLSDATRAAWAAEAFSMAREHGIEVFSYYHLFQQADDPNRWDTGIVQLHNGLGWPASLTRSVSAIRAVTGGHDRLRPEADVNGDGLSDLVTLHSAGSAYVYPGRPFPHFPISAASFSGTMLSAQYGGTGHYVIDIADVTGDARADLVTLHSGGTAYVYSGQSDGAFGSGTPSFAGTMQPGLLAPGGHQPIAVADVNGDGRADLVSFHEPSQSVYVYGGTVGGGFAPGVASFGGTMDSARFDHAGHYFLDVADVTGDGRGDLVTLRSNGSAYVYPGQSTGAFGGPIASFAGTMNPAFDDGMGHEPVGVGDVNGDRRADLVTVMNGTAYVYPGQSSGAFGASVPSFAGTLVSSLFGGVGHEIAGVLDVDGDGYADLVTVHSSGNGYVYRGEPTGKFNAGAVASFAGTFMSSRGGSPGHQMVIEKPFWRRLGCAANGCH